MNHLFRLLPRAGFACEFGSVHPVTASQCVAAAPVRNDACEVQAGSAAPELREFERLCSILQEGRAGARVEAARALAHHGADALGPLCEALEDWSVPVRVAAAVALGDLGDRRATPVLCRALPLWHTAVRRAVADALGRLGDPSAAGPLRLALSDPAGVVRVAAAEALTRLGDPAALPALRSVLADPAASPALRGASARLLADIGGAGAVDAIHSVLQTLRGVRRAGRAERRGVRAAGAFLLITTAVLLLCRASLFSVAMVLPVLVLGLFEYRQTRRAADEILAAVIQALRDIAEHHPSRGLRQTLPDLCAIAADPLRRTRATREISRAAVLEIEAATDHIKDLPLAAAAALPDVASLPLVGEDPAWSNQHDPRFLPPRL